MNTPQSMAIGWGTLLIAGVGSFYFAKKEIDERRRLQRDAGVRPTEKKQWYERLDDPPAEPATPKSSNATNPPPNGSASIK
ncbi:uncharacterized protein EI90DRAFT_3074107 [Cantharellus anzutake]|uniref:uncharacterized protein n=1 Tax=Cantharellus anzutake TaxID=1750568 RepID=UPI001905C74A|nr:uncharacterized protein EI90DRAFT_3074107 [Cantharellus anzutake]KAF8324848.1 hypothetical protein EI90DRAFT_3074107 [Cantharellus anzutake]